MQRCRAWLRLHGITSKRPAPSNKAGPAGHDSEPPPYHDFRITSDPATDIASITSAINTVAINTIAIAEPSALVSGNIKKVAEVISRMAHAVATTPHARDYHNWGKPADGRRVCVTGTAEALMTGIDNYLDIVLMQLAWGDGYLLRSSFRSRDNALQSIYMKTIYSPLASASIITKNFIALAIGIESILSFIQPVACVPAVAAAITSALTNVAKAVAAAPEESMVVIAELYASYADLAAHSIVRGTTAAQSLRDGRALAATIAASHSSGPKSSAADKSVSRARNALQGQTNQG